MNYYKMNYFETGLYQLYARSGRYVRWVVEVSQSFENDLWSLK